MSAGPSPVPAPEAGLGRNLPRHSLSVPLDMITLRSGIPDSLPGRCTDISEAGLGAAVAGELALDQHVALELKLPHVALPLRARAIVRHHSQFHCGLQFVNLSIEQREMIRFWAYRNAVQPPEKDLRDTAVQTSGVPAPVPVRSPKRGLRIQIRRQHIYLLLAITLVLAACAWLYWEWSWRKLEKSLSAALTPPLQMLVLSSSLKSGHVNQIFPPARMKFHADL